MAKKNYTTMTAYGIYMVQKGPDKSVITFRGNNSKGTQVTITIVLDDYQFPYMIKDMVKIATDRATVANERLNKVKKAVE